MTLEVDETYRNNRPFKLIANSNLTHQHDKQLIIDFSTHGFNIIYSIAFHQI